MVSLALVRSVVVNEVVFVEMEGGERFEDVGNVQMYWEASDALLVLTYHVLSYPPGISA